MVKNGVISVIVPVYKVEKYLRECIESIIRQTYSQLEIILIDDESPDNCGAICEEYAARDSRITVIHRKNGGAAAARNAGLRIAAGEYLAFVDSDDYLEPDAYETMIKAMEANHADAVQCGFRLVYMDGAVDTLTHDRITKYDTEEYLRRYTHDWTCSLLWDKLFKRDLLNGVLFEEGHLIDDEFFTYQEIMNARTMLYVPQIIYNYRQRRSSVMNDAAGGERRLFDRMECLSKRRRQIEGRFPELKQVFDVHYADSLLHLAKDHFVTARVIREIKHRLFSFCISGGRKCLSTAQTKCVLAFLLTNTKKQLKDKDSGTEKIPYQEFV